jgi:hypothetical protein
MGSSMQRLPCSSRLGLGFRGGKSEKVVKPNRIDVLVKELIRELGHDEFAKRETATKDLHALGELALDALRKAAADGDPEVRVRASRLVEAIEDNQAFVFNGKNLTGWRGLAECWKIGPPFG